MLTHGHVWGCDEKAYTSKKTKQIRTRLHIRFPLGVAPWTVRPRQPGALAPAGGGLAEAARGAGNVAEMGCPVLDPTGSREPQSKPG